MTMQLVQLAYVVSVAEEGHFTAAARRLHVAQPSVSSAVRALEAELGAPLFNRSRSEVTLSAAGEAFVPWARQVLADCEAGRLAVRELLGLRRGRLAVGATPSLVTRLLPPVIATYHSAYPDIDLTIDEAGSQDLVGRIEGGELDLALVILPVDRPGIDTSGLLEEELVLAVNRDHRLADRSEVRLAELRGVPLVMFRRGYDLREAALEACRRAGVQATLAVEGLEMDGVLALTAAGVGAAVLPASMVDADGPLRALRFRRADLKRTVGLAVRRDRPLSPAARALVEQLHQAISDLGTVTGEG
jgi:DNA-binding transcriptional LysR family regulator